MAHPVVPSPVRWVARHVDAPDSTDTMHRTVQICSSRHPHTYGRAETRSSWIRFSGSAATRHTVDLHTRRLTAQKWSERDLCNSSTFPQDTTICQPKPHQTHIKRLVRLSRDLESVIFVCGISRGLSPKRRFGRHVDTPTGADTILRTLQNHGGRHSHTY